MQCTCTCTCIWHLQPKWQGMHVPSCLSRNHSPTMSHILSIVYNKLSIGAAEGGCNNQRFGEQRGGGGGGKWGEDRPKVARKSTPLESPHHTRHSCKAAKPQCLMHPPKPPAGAAALDLVEPARAEERSHTVPRRPQISDQPVERLQESWSPLSTQRLRY